MFDTPKYISNSFNISFQRQPGVRRMSNEFEDLLKGQYYQPQIIPVPDDLDPEVPRLIFGSEHGFSQIIISQVSATLNVTYSPDWQVDISKGKDYLNERVPILFEIIKLFKEAKLYFSGLMTIVRLSITGEKLQSVAHLTKLLLNNRKLGNPYDIQLKTTTIIAERFFSNITLQNYRQWENVSNYQEIPRLSHESATEHGIEITGDFNDRYAFNEDIYYYSDQTILNQIIEKGINEVNNTIGKLKEL